MLCGKQTLPSPFVSGLRFIRLFGFFAASSVSNDWALILCGFAIQVSKDWHKLCFDGQLWKTLDATGYYDRIPVDQLSKIITTAGPFVRILNLRYSPHSVGA